MVSLDRCRMVDSETRTRRGEFWGDVRSRARPRALVPNGRGDLAGMRLN